MVVCDVPSGVGAEAMGESEVCDGISLVRLRTRDVRSEFAWAVRDGMLTRPKSIPCRFFYDDAGSELFERICEQPEYYLTRTEDSILQAHAVEMVADLGRRVSLVELGSGSSVKTRHLLSAVERLYEHIRYFPIDLSESILLNSANALRMEYPGLEVTALSGHFEDAMEWIMGGCEGPRLIVFLGSSIGNFEFACAVEMLRGMRTLMGPSDRLLLGTDLVKDPGMLRAAYDDSAGVTAAFNRNLLVRANRELGGEFVIERFRHLAEYEPIKKRVGMYLVSELEQEVWIEGLGLKVHFARGERIHTENAHKYDHDLLERIARLAGFAEEANWSDSRGWFRVQRWRKA